MSEETSYAQVCTKYNAGNKPITGKSDEDPIKKRETTVNKVQPTERQTARRKVPTIKEVTVEETKKAYCREATTLVGMRGSEFLDEHNGILVRTMKVNFFLPEAVPVLLRQPIFHMDS